MWVVFNPPLLVHSDLTFFFLGFPVWYGSLQTLRRRPVLLPSIWSRLQRETWWCGNRWWRRCRGRGGVWSYWIVREVSPKSSLPLTYHQTLCQDGHYWLLHLEYSKRLCYFVGFKFYSISSSTRRKALFFIYYRLTLRSSLYTSTFSATHFTTDSI